MRFLADAGISPSTPEFLRKLGHNAIHVRDLGMQRAADREIIGRARLDDRIVLTFDLMALDLYRPEQAADIVLRELCVTRCERRTP